MSRLLLSSVGSGTPRSIAVLIVMSMAATGVVIMTVTDSIAFRVSVGTAASAGHADFASPILVLRAVRLQDGDGFVSIGQLRVAQGTAPFSVVSVYVCTAPNQLLGHCSTIHLRRDHERTQRAH